jgi:RNase P subunit RPR2
MMMEPPQGQQQFDPNQYTHIKPTRPRNNKTLRMCPVCKKLGYIYLLDKNGTKFIYYIHYNEPPIGLTILKGKPIGFRYRRCTKGGKTYSTMEEAFSEAEEENSRAQVKQHRVRQIQHKGLVFVPMGKRLTICTKCNKPGYKYKTYFQHYNEPPIGKVMLKGKEIGDRYRRCYLTTQKVKQDNIDHVLSSEANQRENSQTHSILRADSILRDLGKYIEESRSTLSKVRDLGKYIEESRSTLSKEDEMGKDYKKMYWDLIDMLSTIVEDTNRYTFI